MIRLWLSLSLFVPSVFVLLPTGGPTAPLLALATAMTAGLAVALVLCAVCTQLDPSAGAARIRTVALRERARRAGFLRLRDPDARGRARPRAPSRRLAAA